MKQLVSEANPSRDFKERFFEGLLLPNKLTEEFMRNDQNHVEKTISDVK